MAAACWRRLFRRAIPALVVANFVLVPVAMLIPAVIKARRAAEASVTT